MLITKVDSPYSRTSADIQDTLDLSLAEIRWAKTQFVIKGEKEQVVLQVWEYLSTSRLDPVRGLTYPVCHFRARHWEGNILATRVSRYLHREVDGN